MPDPIPEWGAMEGSDDERWFVLFARVDENDVLWEWQESRAPCGARRFRGVTAVCRPESCADGHRCGRLDVGIIEETTTS